MGNIVKFDQINRNEKKETGYPSEAAYLCVDHNLDMFNFIKSILPYFDDAAKEMCSIASLKFEKFTILEEDLDDFLERVDNMLDDDIECELALCYTFISRSGTTYRLTVHAIPEDENLRLVSDLIKMDTNHIVSVYCPDECVWKTDAEVIQNNEMLKQFKKLSDSHSPEADIMEMLLTIYPEITDDDYRKLKSKSNLIFKLYNATNRFMTPDVIEVPNKKNDPSGVNIDRFILCLRPDDPFRHGFAVTQKDQKLILNQYLEPVDIFITEDDIHPEDQFGEDFYTVTGPYIMEVDRTSDMDIVKHCLRSLANRYTKEDVYTLPLSFYASLESTNLENIGRRIFKRNERDISETEKKCAELTRKRIQKYLRKF